MSVGVGVPHLLREKSHHSRMSVSAHRGVVSCMDVRAQGFGLPPRVFTAGDDGSLRLWNGRTLTILVEAANLTRHRISCLSIAGDQIYMGTSGGEIIIVKCDGRPVSKFQAHKSCVTCLQVVNRGRLFTGSTDGSVKFYGSDGEVIRQFPLHPKDYKEPILSIKATSVNLLFTGSDQGVIRVYNLREELIKVLKTSSLSGVPLNLMEVIHVQNKVSIICAHRTLLTMWYLTLEKDDFGEYEIIVDTVKTISSRMPGGRITALKAVLVNPLRTNRPSVYLGNSSGAVQVIVPTGKFGSVYDNYNRRALAPKFKQYTFKDVNGSVSCICAGGGRLYAGTVGGAMYMWKECLAMMNLRKWTAGRPDTHGYRARSRPSRGGSVTVLLEPRQDDEPAMDENSLRAFAKVAESDLTDTESENQFSNPELISLNESIPERSPAPSMRGSARTNSPARLTSQPQRTSSSSVVQRNSVAQISSPAPSPGLTYEQEIIKLLTDSAAELATFPEPNMNAPITNLTQSMQMLSTTPSASPSQVNAPAPAKVSASSPANDPGNGPTNDRCVVCLENNRNSILYSCGHQCTCLGCGKELLNRKMTCPMCRSPIKDCIQLFK